MSIPPIGSPNNVLLSSAVKTPATTIAPDGDTLAVEKAQLAAKQQAALTTNGLTSATTSPVSTTPPTKGGVNKLA